MMDFADLEADFARIQWPVPHLIGPAINEDDEELLLPLEGRLMELPPLQMDFGVAILGQNLPRQNQGLLTLFLATLAFVLYHVSSQIS
jgi:hypothetical protein